MLADQLDYVIGVDPHRDAHTIAVVEAVGPEVHERPNLTTPQAAARRFDKFFTRGYKSPP